MHELQMNNLELIQELEKMKKYIQNLQDQLQAQDLLKGKCNELLKEKEGLNEDYENLARNKNNMLGEMDKLKL